MLSEWVAGSSGIRNRIAVQADYETNLRAELEIMALHEKWDNARLAELEAKMDRIIALLEPPSEDGSHDRS